ncbi:ribosomal-protein-alanine N-acetyltransferase [Gemmobacter aquatilis]|uniref:Ribosomal-protein-alanine N-acetyltransferase n=1 Tax=Gemmobacter aquatilis TaxID=933059 RepID=A0A1H8M0M0_9RHOB|nr:GNAT family N-acetyltransferase [Gemmobacter aquatilis]SEO10698.1 ribosomal-protein-alanine N-acetyltransferase [Gemmobacter aquatilis]
MTPEAMAALHARCFTTPRPWSAAEIAGFLADPLCFALLRPAGFLIGRVVADEAELLTVAVAPDARRQGVGADLVADFLRNAALHDARTAFLEVSAENPAAIALYARAGFTPAGRRRGYYRQPDGQKIDALVLSRPIYATEGGGHPTEI